MWSDKQFYGLLSGSLTEILYGDGILPGCFPGKERLTLNTPSN